MLQDYVVLDLETTGLSPKTDRIIEIGAARVRQGKIEQVYTTFVNPGRELDGAYEGTDRDKRRRP